MQGRPSFRAVASSNPRAGSGKSRLTAVTGDFHGSTAATVKEGRSMLAVRTEVLARASEGKRLVKRRWEMTAQAIIKGSGHWDSFRGHDKKHRTLKDH